MRANNLLAIGMVLAICCVSGCHSPSPTITGPSSAPPASGNVAVFIQVNSAPGPFTLTLNGQTMTTTETRRFDVPEGVHVVTGRQTALNGAAFLAFRIHGLEGVDVGGLGGPEKGTLQNLEGPLATLNECEIQYRVVSPETEFRFQFKASRSVTINRRC